MKSKRKREAPGRAREVLAWHLRNYMERTYKGDWGRRGDPTRMIKEFSRDSGVSETAIQRASSPETYASGANIDTIERLARAMHVAPHELLIPPLQEDETD